MERVQVTKITLANGKTIAHDDPWPRKLQVLDPETGGLQEIDAQARVGAIFWIETATTMESWVEEEEENGERYAVTHSTHSQTPGHFEIWAAPNAGSPLERAGETRCIRIQREHVIDHEEAWPMLHAHEVVKNRRASTFLPDIGEDTVEGAPSNGASASVV